MPANTDWFHEARYGMFIHWGAYAVAARGEWVMNRENIPVDEYAAKYVDNFKAERFDPREWARVAKDAGMKYLVLTTRHHDGFCLWNTKTSDYNAVQRGPKRDLVRDYVDAVRDAGLGVGLYYSVADWHHPDYPDGYCRDWPSAWRDEDSRKRFFDYYFAQLKELMTEYGAIDILWYDGCIPQPTNGSEVNTWIKSVQPNIMINNRNGAPFDFQCSEQAIRPPSNPELPWEACLTLNDNWGYHAGDDHYKSAKDVIMMLTQTAEHRGNLMLNVGPMSDGVIPPKSAAILREAGDWLRRNGEFLANSSRSPYSWLNWGRLTTKGNIAYLHIFHRPGDELCVAEIANRVLSARMLDGGQPLPFEQSGDRLFVRNLPNPLPDPLVTTIVLELDGTPKAHRQKGEFWIPG
ncbi:MAG: alpha-L-fucosidase [Capsulimonadaceae bacterium]|nr:alpha-L-fucosidase [Capsulimonadaceae bacterium]